MLDDDRLIAGKHAALRTLGWPLTDTLDGGQLLSLLVRTLNPGIAGCGACRQLLRRDRDV